MPAKESQRTLSRAVFTRARRLEQNASWRAAADLDRAGSVLTHHRAQ